MRPYMLCVFAALTACAPQYTETLLAPGASAPVNEARFAARPDLLHQAFRDSCQGPTDEYSAPDGTTGRCQMVPSPDIAANLILRYDGALEIPHIVVERQTRPVSDGYVVAISYFASIPQKAGAPRRVYLRSPELDRNFAALFEAFGGVPLSGDPTT